MDFKTEINELENLQEDNDYINKKGSIPILFSAVHTVEHIKEDGSIKLSEPYTKAISLYLNKHYNSYSFVKCKSTGIDSNKDNYDDFNIDLRRFIKDNNIKLLIDLHGASKERDFDVEFGTLNNMSADFSTIKELEEAFKENGVKNIVHNDPFKGGAITIGALSIDDIDVIQLEINGKYRDYYNIDNLKIIINALSKFIKQYDEYIKRR
jgi:hypothetical protein